MIRDYQPKGVKFFYVYKALAHPGTNGYVAPFTLDERLQHVKTAKEKLGTQAGWICDSLENDVKHAFGDRPNSEFVFDPDGKLLIKRAWSDPNQLRHDLEKLVGEVERPTRIADLHLNTNYEATKVASGVVERVRLPGPMQPLQIEPAIEKSKQPFYAKLRAEADRDLLRTGSGMLYLGFFLDPLYEVHWNNQAEPLRFEFSDQRGVSLQPNSGKGPAVKANADSDPREFLVKVASDGREPLTLTVHYFACDNAETFCEPVTQTYTIYLSADADGGNRRAAGNGLGPGDGGNVADRFKQQDKDKDGKLSKDEVPEQMLKFFDRLDSNADGSLDEKEIQRMRTIRGGPGHNQQRP